MRHSRDGVVLEFDSAVGVGIVRENSGAEFQFQCTQIGDGSREIDPDSAVSFDVEAGGPGRWEAVNLISRSS